MPKEAQIDAPGYTIALDTNKACISCKFGNSYDNFCKLYNFTFEPWYTCNSYAARPEPRPYWEAVITPHLIEASKPEEFEGKEWEVTIIGPKTASDIITVDKKDYIKSLNGRLYACDAVESSTPNWEGVKVYDNHLTNEEFIQKQGMRSPVQEWLGTIVSPFFDKAGKALKGTFKVVEDGLAKKLKNAWDSGVLNSIGLSIDTFVKEGQSVIYEGKTWPVIEGFEKIISVDLVGDPAAGGTFNRLIAANITEVQMTEQEVQAMIQQAVAAAMDAQKATFADTAKTLLAEALNADSDDPAPEIPLDNLATVQPAPEVLEAINQAKLARCELLLERKLIAAKLNGHEKIVREAFAGKVFDEAELDKMIANAKEAQAASDPTGRVTESGSTRQPRVETGLDDRERLEVEFMRLIMGNAAFQDIEHNQESFVSERVREGQSYKSWVNAGKPNTGGYRRLSNLIYDFLGGDPMMDQVRSSEASALATITKNTVNIMVAADYSQMERWYESIVNTEEVDTIDTSTLARLYGVNTLAVVDKGGPYTELAQADEEETATFVKRGNYIGVPLEDLMLDKLNYFRSIPKRLSNTWYNTLSSQTSALFTTNSAAGPVLSDTGALFNATAVGTPGGHANLLTTALAFASYDTVVTSMISQTDQPLGAGRRLTEMQMGLNLLIPVNLRATAHQIRNTENQPGTSNLATNPYGPGGNQPNVVLVPDWTDTNNWAVVADKGRYPSIWHIFPRGGRTPQLFTADSDVAGAMFTNDEMRFKVRMMTYEFSATYRVSPVADFRPLHKSNVA